MKLRGITGKLWLAMLVLVVAVLGLTALIQVKVLEKIYYQQQEARFLTEGEKLAEIIVTEQDPYLINRQINLLTRLMNASVLIIDSRGTIYHWQGMEMICRRMMDQRTMSSLMEQGIRNRRGPPWQKPGYDQETIFPGTQTQVLNQQMMPLSREQIRQVLEGKSLVHREYNPFFETEVLVTGIPLYKDSQVAGALFIHAPLAPLVANLKSLQEAGVYSLFLAVVIATLLSLVLSRSLTGPLIQMNQVAQAMVAGDFTQKVPLQSKDELGILAGSLNTLSAKLEEKIIALENVDKNRREFVANVSHELRTPLTIIQGYTEAIQDGLARQEGKEEEYLNNILEEILRLRRLVDDLLNLRQMEAGQVVVKREPVDMEILVQQVADRFSPTAEDKGVVLKVSIEKELPPVTGDADRLKQVLINLVDNAMRFTPSGGEVKIAIKRLPKQLQVVVSDTGPGIAKEELPLIWERFYKGDKSRHRSGGSGLGLAIARQIIELHGGTIYVQSEPGKGTEFVFNLPTGA